MNQELYTENYVFTGLNIIKIVVVVYSMLLSIYVFYINQYDVFVLNRTNRQKALITKVIAALSVIVTNVIIFCLLFSLFWLILSDVELKTIMSILLKLVLFTLFYSLFYIVLLIMFHNLFVVIIPFIGYLVSNFSIDYGIARNQISAFSKGIHLLFPDVAMFNEGFMFIYGDIFIIGYIAVFFIILLQKYDTSDIKI